MGIKSKCLVTALVVSVSLTGCGGSQSGSSYTAYSDNYAVGAVAADSIGFNGMYDVEYAESYSEDKSFGGYNEDAGFTYEETVTESTTQSAAVNRDMLIYCGNVSLTTKNFSNDLKQLKSMLSDYDCFFENESTWTEYSYDDRDLYHYSATIRVASGDYEKLLDGLNSIGTMKSLSSSCENVSAEYTDTIVAIDIYEAERDRYVKLLSTITDDQYAIEVQRELTDIELKLAQYRARKQNIETDVTYSYITIDLREVREYVQQTEYSANFFERLWNTVVNTFYGFTNFLENVLFFVIEKLPYLVFWYLIYLLLKKIGIIASIRNLSVVDNAISSHRAHKEEKRKRKEAITNAKKRISEEEENSLK